MVCDCVKLRVSQDTDLIMFLAFAWSYRPISFPPAPSKPQTTAPALMPMATDTTMIVDRSPMPEAAKPALAVASADSIPSTILTPCLYFLYREALKFRSFSRRNLTSAICCRRVTVCALKWPVETHRAMFPRIEKSKRIYWSITTTAWSGVSAPSVKHSLLRETGPRRILSRFNVR